jgi:iron complex transport system substrate-binding protein
VPPGRVVALSAASVAQIYDSVRSVAGAIDAAAPGETLIADMRSRIDSVREAVRNWPMPTVVLLEWTDPIFATGNWGPELVEAAGGNPLLGQKAAHSAAIPWGRVLDADPDVLIVAPCGFDFDRTAQEVPIFEARPGWFDLKAVKEGRVAFADGNKYFNRSGTTIVETVEILAEILHGYQSPSGRHSEAWRRYGEMGRTQSVS